MPNRIREIRKQHKMTMKQLGLEIGVAESTISQYETGKRQPDNEALLKIGELFDVTVGYLLGVEPPKEKAPTVFSERSMSDDDLIFALWGDDKDITDEDLEDVRRYAEFVAQRRKEKK